MGLVNEAKQLPTLMQVIEEKLLAVAILGSTKGHYIRLYNLISGALAKQFIGVRPNWYDLITDGHTSVINDLAYIPSTKQLVSVSNDWKGKSL